MISIVSQAVMLKQSEITQKVAKSKSNGHLFSLQIIHLPTGIFRCPFSLKVPLKTVHLDNIVPP